MDSVGVAILIAAIAATTAVVLLLNRIGPTPPTPLRRVAVFAGSSLVAAFLVASVYSFLALGSLRRGGSAPDAEAELGSALVVGATVGLAVGGAGIVGCILVGMLASRWTERVALRFWAAAGGALGAAAVVVLVSGLLGAVPLVPIAGFGLALGSIARWPGGFLRRAGADSAGVSTAAAETR